MGLLHRGRDGGAAVSGTYPLDGESSIDGPWTAAGVWTRSADTSEVTFRYRYYSAIETIDADLQAWLRFYNFERPHRGYRTQGRTLASILFRGEPDYLSQMGA